MSEELLTDTEREMDSYRAENERIRAAEADRRDYAKWRGWLDANGYKFDDDGYQAEAFGAGMQAARELARDGGIEP